MPKRTADTPAAKQSEKKHRTSRSRKHSTTLFTHARKLPLIRCLDDGQFVKITHDVELNEFMADLIDESEANQIIYEQNPPLIVRIRGRPDKRIVHLWDPRINQYDGGRTVDADDPIVTRNRR